MCEGVWDVEGMRRSTQYFELQRLKIALVCKSDALMKSIDSRESGICVKAEEPTNDIIILKEA